MMFSTIGRGFGGFGGPGACHGYGLWYGGFGMWHMGIWLIVIAVLIALFVWQYKKHGHGHRDPAMSLLREKFAKGEITEEEYLSRKALLSRK